MRQDRWVASRLGHLGASGVYVELVANDGHAGSNTAWFDHVGGFSGVCIEPFHDNFERLQLNRPRCTNVFAGVGDKCPGPERTLVAFLPPDTGFTGWVDTYDPKLLRVRRPTAGLRCRFWL